MPQFSPYDYRHPLPGDVGERNSLHWRPTMSFAMLSREEKYRIANECLHNAHNASLIRPIIPSAYIERFTHQIMMNPGYIDKPGGYETRTDYDTLKKWAHMPGNSWPFDSHQKCIRYGVNDVKRDVLLSHKIDHFVDQLIKTLHHKSTNRPHNNPKLCYAANHGSNDSPNKLTRQRSQKTLNNASTFFNYGQKRTYAPLFFQPQSQCNTKNNHH